MRYFFFAIFSGIMLIGGVMGITSYVHPSKEFSAGMSAVAELSSTPIPVDTKTIEQRMREAKERSSRIKGVYMTAEVANDGGAGATHLRNSIITLAETTEINGIVIDVKEVCGPEYNEVRMRKLIDELHAKNIWVIARIVTFKDASEIYAHPEWYLTRAVPKTVTDDCARKMHLRAKGQEGLQADAVLWRDNKGGYWLDPANQGARDYIAHFSKKIIDLGFDELQFDYIRFPSDGDVEKAKFPVWDGKTPKFEILKSFFSFLHDELKQYKPDIILSADLFGYAAIRAGDVGIGQRLEDIGSSFDYVSFMVYPSHYYSGLNLPADPVHDLPAVNFNRNEVRMYPGITVGRSLQTAQNFLDTLRTLATSSTVLPPRIVIGKDILEQSIPHVRLRPWLEDFFHEADKLAGRPYGAEKVRLQIDAAESVDNNGWLLWNAANVYTKDALKKK